MVTLIPALAKLNPQGLGRAIAGLLGWQFEPALAAVPLAHAVAYLETGVFLPEETDAEGAAIPWDPYLLEFAAGLALLLTGLGLDKDEGLAALTIAHERLVALNQ